MDDRDWRPPIALARNAPIAQAVLRLPFAPALMFGARDDGGLRLVNRHAVQEMRIHNFAGAGVSGIALKIGVSDITV